MTKTTKTANYFTINFIEKTICGSPASFKKASTGMGAVYEELLAKMNTHPDFKMMEVKPKENNSKRTYEGLNYTFMEKYIRTMANADTLLKKYKLVRKNAEDTVESAYPVVKKWFLKNFSTKEKPFNMEEATARICEFEGTAPQNSDANEGVEALASAKN